MTGSTADPQTRRVRRWVGWASFLRGKEWRRAALLAADTVPSPPFSLCMQQAI